MLKNQESNQQETTCWSSFILLLPIFLCCVILSFSRIFLDTFIRRWGWREAITKPQDKGSIAPTKYRDNYIIRIKYFIRVYTAKHYRFQINNVVFSFTFCGCLQIIKRHINRVLKMKTELSNMLHMFPVFQSHSI